MLNSSIVNGFWLPANVHGLQFQKKREGEETDDGCSLLDMVDTAFTCLLGLPSPTPSAPFQIPIHEGNSCIHMCLDYTTLPGDWEFFLVGVNEKHRG